MVLYRVNWLTKGESSKDVAVYQILRSGWCSGNESCALRSMELDCFVPNCEKPNNLSICVDTEKGN
jgi:hypothetical protein